MVTFCATYLEVKTAVATFWATFAKKIGLQFIAEMSISVTKLGDFWNLFTKVSQMFGDFWGIFKTLLSK